MAVLARQLRREPLPVRGRIELRHLIKMPIAGARPCREYAAHEHGLSTATSAAIGRAIYREINWPNRGNNHKAEEASSPALDRARRAKSS